MRACAGARFEETNAVEATAQSAVREPEIRGRELAMARRIEDYALVGDCETAALDCLTQHQPASRQGL
mgnify:CR=1 FL=1